VSVSASIGVAVSHAGDTASSLLQTADSAMYAAKAAGKARYYVLP
jgi:PleD family two-component response regulator